MQISNDFIYFPDKQLLVFGSGERWIMDDGGDFAGMQVFIDAHAGKYIFTCLSYDLKNELEDLKSQHVDAVEFPIVVLWSPDYVVDLSNFTFIQGKETPAIRQEAVQLFHRIIEAEPSNLNPSIQFKSRITRDVYINSVNQVKAEIQYGNCYELNFCQEFYAENVVDLDIFSLFRSVYNETKAPFSVLMYLEDWSILCFSPERYVQKVGNKLISQPIKGTIRRGENEEEDKQLQKTLLGDTKELSENVMITDLVRNDFSKIAQKGSVKVEHLCELQTFETLHHLVTTIGCEIESSVNFEAILRASFPMGSMTGAPKVRVMELIEKHESFRRGIYSGSIGIIYPNGDFDCNVVIRTILHNARKKIMTCAVGSAITMKSDPEKEYDECLVKVNKILQFFK